jgi:proteasome lid subunit RPN8/RPN11/exonuclease VII small subunit
MELATQPFPPVEHEFRIFIEEKAFDRICSSADTMREVGGILVGDVLRDENGPYIRVDAIIEALHAEESGTELTITHATWNHIHQQMDTIHTGKRIIGWYHTHPNFGIFLSERDHFIQQSFFNLAFQIALVYDPVQREHGIFTWRENKPWRVRQYWIGTNQHLWDDVRDAPDVPSTKRRTPPKTQSAATAALTASAANTPAEAQPFGDLLGSTWLTGAVLFGALLGFLLGMTWSRQRTGGEELTRAQSAQNAIAGLDSDLLAVIRGSLSDEAFAKTFDEGIARLNRAVESLKPLDSADPAVKSAMQSVTEAQQSLSRARQDRLVAHRMLQQIEQVIRRSRTPDSVAQELLDQRAALAGVYVELARDAAQDKDKARVDEMLKRAAYVDPERKSIYEQQLKNFEQQVTESQPATQAKDGKAQDAAPPAPGTPPGTNR